MRGERTRGDGLGGRPTGSSLGGLWRRGRSGLAASLEQVARGLRGEECSWVGVWGLGLVEDARAKACDVETGEKCSGGGGQQARRVAKHQTRG